MSFRTLINIAVWPYRVAFTILLSLFTFFFGIMVFPHQIANIRYDYGVACESGEGWMYEAYVIFCGSLWFWTAIVFVGVLSVVVLKSANSLRRLI